MKRLLKILQFIFLLPLVPIFGIAPAEGGGDSGSGGDGGASGTDEDVSGAEGEETDAGGDGEDTEVTLTQKELDERIKKEARAMARAEREKKKGKTKPAASEGGEGDNQLQEREAKATQRLLEGTLRMLGPELEITKNGIAAAAKLADFSGCYDDDGNLDEDAVKDALSDFLATYPEFQRKDDSSGTLGGKGNPPRKTVTQKPFAELSSEERMELKSKDPALYSRLRDEHMKGR